MKTQNGSVYTGTLHTVYVGGGAPNPYRNFRSARSTGHARYFADRQNDGNLRNPLAALQRANHFGASYSKGNQATQYSLGASVEYPSERWMAGGDYNSTLASSTGSTASTRNALDLYASRLLRWDNWFYAGSQTSFKAQNKASTSGGCWKRNRTLSKEYRPD